MIFIILLTGFILGIIFMFLMAAKEMIDEADRCEICGEEKERFDRKKDYDCKCK